VPIERVTDFVGRNESGKTAFLKALHKFKAASGENYDPQRDFPRDRYTRDFKQESASEWPVCSVRFSVAKEYAEELKNAHGLDVLIKEIEFTKDYSNAYSSWGTTPEFNDDPVPAGELVAALDKFEKAARRLDSKVADQKEADQQERNKIVAAASPLSDAAGKLTALREAEGVKLLTQARDQINGLSSPLSASIVEEFVASAKAMLARAQAPSKEEMVFKSLSEKMPVFIYFEDYGVLEVIRKLGRLSFRAAWDAASERDRGETSRFVGSDRSVLAARGAADSGACAGAAEDLRSKAGCGATPQAGAAGLRGGGVCAAHRMPVEGVAQGALWQRQRGSQAVSGMGGGGLLRGAVEGRPGRIRRDARHRLALAKHRWGVDEGPAGATSRRPQPDGSGKKMEASATCWWTAVASRYRSS
jgi:hypothetical protein